MAERIVKVSLVAQVNNYVAGMEKAAKSTREVGSEAEKLAAKKQAIGDLGVGLLAIGAVAAVGVGLAVKAFADFDQKLSNIQAATNESAGNMDLLRAAAIKAGQDTAFSAGEAADAVTELAKAGVATADILGGALTGALDLAAAGEISVARAAEIAATAMTQFNLKGTQVGRVADLLSSGANKAQGGVEELSGALSQGGLVAAATGLTIEETVGTLSAFASAGLLGSDAGTSFKSMLQRLTPQSKEAKDRMDELGISAYDAQGAFIGMEAFAGNLQDGLKDLTPEARNAAQAVIFGTDAVRASNILYEQGAEGIGKWISEVDDSGAAARTAAIKLDNLNGDLQILKGSFETALIQSGAGANDVLRELVQTTTGLVNLVADIPGPLLSTGLAFGAVTAAVGLVGGTALLAIPKIAALKVAMSTLGVSGNTLARGISGSVAGFALLSAAIGYYIGQQVEAKNTAREFKDTLDPLTGAVTDYTREVLEKKLAESGAFAAAKEAGIAQNELTDAVMNGGKELEEANEKLSKNNTLLSFAADISKTIDTGNAQKELRDLRTGIVRAGEDLEDQAASAEESADKTDDAAVAYQNAADKAGELQGNLSTLIDTINEANGVGQDAVSQNINYQSALADVDEQIKNVREGVEGFASGLSDTTATGRDNLGMLNDLASSSQGAAKAQFDLDGKTDDYRATLERGRQAVIDRAVALGATADEAEDLANKIYAIPTEREFEMVANLQKAQASIDRFITGNSGRRVELIVDGVAGRRVVGSDVTAKASGGAITGPGTGTSDTAGLYALSNGEHVLTAAEVAAMGGQSAVYDFRRGLRGQAYMTAPSALSGGGGGSSSRGGDTFTIYETTDPVATAQAVQRRQSALGSV